MKLSNLIIVVCCALIFTMCTTQEKQVEPSNSDIIEINFDTLEDEDIAFSNIFDKVTLIPLETNDSSLIDHIWGVTIVRDTIYIQMPRKLLQFTIEGKFIRQIGKNGKGPGEYQHVGAYYIDRQNNNIYVNGGSSILLCYNTKGEYQNDIKIPSTSGFFTIQNNLKYSAKTLSKKEDSCLLSISNLNGTLIEKKFNTDIYSKGYRSTSVHGRVFSYYNDKAIFKRMLFDTIYRIDNKTLTPIIALNSSNSISAQEVKIVMALKKAEWEEIISSGSSSFAMKNFFLESGKFVGIGNYFEDDNIFTFYFFDNKKIKRLFYFKNESKVVITSNLKNDLLPIGTRFETNYNNSFVSLIRPDSPRLTRVQDRDGTKGIPETELKKIDNLDISSNPILVLYHTRENYKTTEEK